MQKSKRDCSDIFLVQRAPYVYLSYSYEETQLLLIAASRTCAQRVHGVHESLY